MNLFKSTNPENEPKHLQKARKAVTRLSTHELLNFADTVGSGMAKAFSDYRQHGDETSLLEIDRALYELRALNDELRARS